MPHPPVRSEPLDAPELPLTPTSVCASVPEPEAKAPPMVVLVAPSTVPVPEAPAVEQEAKGRGTRRGGLRRVRWTRRPRHGTHEALRPSLHSKLAHLCQFPSRLREQRRRWGPGAAGVHCDRKREAGAAELGPLVQHGARCRCRRPLVTCPHPHPWASPAALHREEQGDQSHGLHHAGQQGLQEWKGARRGGGC